MPIQSGKHCDDARCHSLMSNHVNSKHCLSPQIKKKTLTANGKTAVFGKYKCQIFGEEMRIVHLGMLTSSSKRTKVGKTCS